jgi:hypothetical protein
MPYGGANPAAKGRGGDTELGHLQRGEIILPPDFPQQRPDLFAEIAEFLGNDIGRRTVGGGDDSINPDTGYPEFYFGPGMSVSPPSPPSQGGGFGGFGPPTRFSPTPPTVGGNVDIAAQQITNQIANTQRAKAHALSQVPDKMDFYNNDQSVFDAQGMRDAIAALGLAPGEVSQSNIGKSFMPSVFGDFKGLTDPVTGDAVSQAQLQSMTPAAFSRFMASGPGTVGDPESPFGMALLAGKDIFGAVTSPWQFALEKILTSVATGKNIPFGSWDTGINLGLGEEGEGIFGLGEEGGGILGDFGGWLSGLDADSISTFGPSIAGGRPSNIGSGFTPPPPAPVPPSSSQLLEQQLAGTATSEQREAATTAALNRLSAQTGQNPFTLSGGGLDEPQFADVISRGLARENEQLIDPVSFGRLSNVFDDEGLLRNILTEETGIRKEGFTSDLASAFPGDAFGEIDDNIINSIIEERIGPARQQVSNFAARNLSAPGGTGANEFLGQQETEARERLGEIGGNVQSLNQLGVNAIRDVARSGIRDFELGAGFDVAPFAEQRQSLIGERTGTFGEDVRTQLGSEPLFDVSGALSAGSRAGGVVSGQPQGGEGLLDVIAERELAGRTDRRGLQRSGSGAF